MITANLGTSQLAAGWEMGQREPGVRTTQADPGAKIHGLVALGAERRDW